MFDKEKLSEIIKKCQGEMSLNEFARLTDVDVGYLSRLINMKKKNPPSPNILKKLSDKTTFVTYEELMEICGYINLYGLYDIPLNNDEKKIVRTMLLDYKEFLSHDHSYERFDDYKYVSSLPKDAREKIIMAFRRNSLDLILDKHKNNEKDDYFEFVSEDDAMFPLLDVGDIALIYKQNNIEDGSTLLINMNNHNTIRKFILSDDKTYYKLVAMNGYYKDIDLKITELNNIKVLGKVIKSENKSAFKN